MGSEQSFPFALVPAECEPPPQEVVEVMRRYRDTRLEKGSGMRRAHPVEQIGVPHEEEPVRAFDEIPERFARASGDLA